MSREKKLCCQGTTLLTLLCLLVAPLRGAEPAGKVDAAYVAEIQKFRAARVNSDKMNWATLAGLFWLKPGAHTFGAGPDNEFVLPKGSAPAKCGVFELNNGEVTVKLERDVPGRIDGKATTAAKLQSDAEGERQPTILEINRLQMKVIQRNQRIGVRLKDLASPNLRNFHAAEWYPIDPAYRVVANWEPSDGTRKIIVPNILGDAVPVTIPGVARFTLQGQQFTLTPVEGDPKDSMEFVFADGTTKTETYPAGRMVDAGPVKDGKLIIDFNQAYNPPCAVTPYATCPLPPKENRLAVAVRAGEKYGAKERAAHQTPALP